MIVLIFCSAVSEQEYHFPLSYNDYKTFDTIIPFSGYWLSENYYENIINNKSPKAAQNNSYVVVIPDRTLKATTILYDFHDGFDYYTTVWNLNQFEIWEVNDDIISNFINKIEVISPTRIKIGQDYFLKINPETKHGFLHNGLKDEILVLEEILFMGNYLTNDGKKVKLDKDGQIRGLDKYYYYKPYTDYYDEGMQVDQLILIKSKRDLDWKDCEEFGYRFNSDTLELYKLKCLVFDSVSNNCAEVELGELKYKLLKINNNR